LSQEYKCLKEIPRIIMIIIIIIIIIIIHNTQLYCVYVTNSFYACYSYLCPKRTSLLSTSDRWS